uniref:Mitochondrial import receptor subunit TOM20 homolog n=1 Tax=Sus scrofa TaxID=9823 RepID=A0A8D0W6G7_PIG
MLYIGSFNPHVNSMKQILFLNQFYIWRKRLRLTVTYQGSHWGHSPGRGRKKQKLAKERAGLSKLPDLKDAEAVQKFFLEEIQLGEELLAQGEYEKGVDHLTNAIAVCGQPQQLLQVLQQTLPPPVFQMLLTKLPTISQRIVSAQSLAEDDVE